MQALDKCRLHASFSFHITLAPLPSMRVRRGNPNACLKSPLAMKMSAAEGKEPSVALTPGIAMNDLCPA